MAFAGLDPQTLRLQDRSLTRYTTQGTEKQPYVLRLQDSSRTTLCGQFENYMLYRIACPLRGLVG